MGLYLWQLDGLASLTEHHFFNRYSTRARPTQSCALTSVRTSAGVHVTDREVNVPAREAPVM